MNKKYEVPTIKNLIEAGVHFGHQVKRWHPEMEPYIYTVKKNIHIIDLEETEKKLKEAADFLYGIAQKGGKIVFIGTKKQARDIVEIEGKRSGAMYVTERWLGGTITNFDVIKKNNIDKLLDLKSKKEKGEFGNYTKKERLMIDREIERLERFVGGLTNMKKAPDALFVIDAKREATAVREANRANIPVVALLDTNTDPTNILYPIPGNDDAIKSIVLISKCIADAIEQGYKDFAAGVVKETKKEDSKGSEIKKDEAGKEPEKETKPEEKKISKKVGRPKKSETEKPTKKDVKTSVEKEETKAPAKEKKTEAAKAKSVSKTSAKRAAPKKRGRPKKSESSKKDK